MIITEARRLMGMIWAWAVGLSVINVPNICQQERENWRDLGVKRFTKREVAVHRAGKKKLRSRHYRFALSGLLGTIPIMPNNKDNRSAENMENIGPKRLQPTAKD